MVIEDIRSWDNELLPDSQEEADCDAEMNGDHLDYPLPGDSDVDAQFQIGEEDANLIQPELGAGDFSFGPESSELDETFNGKMSALLTLEPTNCFVPHSEEQKLFHSVMYDLARQMVASADVAQYGPNSPMHRAHFKKCLEEFLDTHLTSFLARVPAEFRVNKKGRMFTPMAIIRKSCNDNFRALLRRKFRQTCLANNTPIPFTFH